MKKNININMCEHEQNFHALDVVFYSFLLFSCAIGRSYLVPCIFFASFSFGIILCSCLELALWSGGNGYDTRDCL
jgi:hypothetical protein